MSRINDALKQAQKTPPQNAPAAPPPFAPCKENSAAGKIIFALVAVLVLAGIFFIAQAMRHRDVHNVAEKKSPAANVPTVVEKISEKAPEKVLPPPPAVATPTAAPATPAPTVVVSAPKLPRLQGIFYSPTAPTAILDGKTVKLGDALGNYRVKGISREAVTLVSANGQETQLKIGN